MKLLWRGLVGAAILATVVHRTGRGPFVTGVSALDAQTLLLGAALAAVTTGACAWRWHLVATELVGHPKPFFAPVAAIITLGITVGQRGRRAAELALGVAVGIVLGGTQALARSYYSLLIPRGKEAEYFSFYHAMDRGTSWFGTLVFGLVYQFTDSYRPAIFALIAFFLVGGFLLTRVDTERGIREAGNARPAVV